jgi:hypothetical protein
MTFITRQIKPEEFALAAHLLTLANDTRPEQSIPNLVKVLDDGEMGSIEFISTKERKYGNDIAQVRYIDVDNVVVLITLVEDSNGDLHELDFWKTNFDKLIKYPKPEEVILDIP